MKFESNQITANDLVFSIGTDTDASIIREVVEGDCYGFRSSPVPTPLVVVDVGAHIGAFARVARETWPQARIRCYEPSNRNFGLLEENVSRHGIEIVKAAVTGQISGEVMYVEPSMNSGWNGDNSSGDGVVVIDEVVSVLIPRAREALTQSQKHMVKAVAIGNVLDELGRIDYLKLDCEGAEVDIIQALKDRMAEIGFIRGEYHGPNSLEQIKEAVSDTHQVWNAYIFDDLGYFSCEPRD